MLSPIAVSSQRGAIRNQKGLEADIDALIEKTVRPMVARKKILFVSPQGACRAPLAAAMAQQHHGQRIRAGFGGMVPASELSPALVQFMSTIGMDMGYRTPMTMDQALHGAVPDLTIVLDKEMTEDPVPGVKTISWPLAAPPPNDDDAMDRLLREVRTRVDTLIDTMD